MRVRLSTVRTVFATRLHIAVPLIKTFSYTFTRDGSAVSKDSAVCKTALAVHEGSGYIKQRRQFWRLTYKR